MRVYCSGSFFPEEEKGGKYGKAIDNASIVYHKNICKQHFKQIQRDDKSRKRINSTFYRKIIRCLLCTIKSNFRRT